MLFLYNKAWLVIVILKEFKVNAIFLTYNFIPFWIISTVVMNLFRPLKYVQNNGLKGRLRKCSSPVLTAQSILIHKIPEIVGLPFLLHTTFKLATPSRPPPPEKKTKQQEKKKQNKNKNQTGDTDSQHADLWGL